MYEEKKQQKAANYVPPSSEIHTKNTEPAQRKHPLLTNLEIPISIRI